jgi:Lon protease-like protein
MAPVGDDTGEDEEDHHDDNNPLARGIDSVMWLPSVSGPPSSSRDPLDNNSNDNNNNEEEDENNTTILPLFPLGSIVYTPNSEHVLNIFEPRYRQMYNDILMNGSKRFVVSMCHPTEDGRFAQVGVLFSLEELKEVSGMTADRVKYICNHRVTGRVRLHKVINPEAWESRDTYLKVQGTIIDDTGHLTAKKNEDADDDDDGEVEKKMDEDIAKSLVTQMKKAAMAEVHPRTPEEEILAKSFRELVELQHDLSEDVRFTRASVRSFGVADGTDIDPNLWTSIRLWQSYAEQRLVAGQNEMQKEFQERLVDYLRKDMEKKSGGGGGEGGGSGGGASGASKKSGGEELPSAIGFQDLSPELQSELIDLQKRMTNELRPLMLEQTLSMQKILEAADHEGRVGLMTYFVEAERKRLQAKKMLKSMFSGGVASKESISEARMAESSTSSSPTTTTTQSTTKEEEDNKPQFFADDGAFQ